MKTAFSRTFSLIAVALLVSMVIIGISFQLLVRDYLEKTAMDDLKKDGQVVAQLVQAYCSDKPLSNRDFSVALTVAASISDADAVICNPLGELILCASDPYGCEHVGLMLNPRYLEQTFRSGGLTDTGTIDNLYSDERYVVSLPIYDTAGERLGIVMVSSSTATTQRIMNRITEIFVFVSILVVVVCVAVITVFLRQQSIPLRNMAKIASDFGHGELNARVKTGGNYSEEIEELALAFNNMASSLQKSEYQRQEFVANVSHELKTPMTTISGYVDGILDGTIPPERQKQYLTLVSDETKRLSRLVRSMLDISRLHDQGGIPESMRSRFDILECAGQVLLSFEQKINTKSLDVQVDFPDLPVYTQANMDYITQVIYNLLDNAVKFCPEKGSMGLEIRTGGSKAYISVFNDGETIPAEELSLVFDRFHKIDKSRSQNRESWGLGLYIVKTIVCSHGENISVSSRDGRTTFTFTLPLVN